MISCAFLKDHFSCCVKNALLGDRVEAGTQVGGFCNGLGEKGVD